MRVLPVTGVRGGVRLRLGLEPGRNVLSARPAGADRPRAMDALAGAPAPGCGACPLPRAPASRRATLSRCRWPPPWWVA